MDPATLFLISTAVSAGGTILGGIGAKQEADLTAFNIETEKRQNQVAAMQQARARRDEYDLATSSNIAAFSAAGRDITTDRSVQAFLEKQKEVAAQDIGRIATQTNVEDLRSDMMAMAARRQGRNALYASLFNAAGTVGEGLYRAEQVRTD
jgi:hypothetical protein